MSRSQGRKRHAKSVIYLYFAGSDSLHMPGRLVSPSFRFALEQRACRGINRPATKTAASGVDYWSIGCRDDYYYSLAINAEQRDSVCTHDAFTQNAESAPLAGRSDP